MPERSLRAAACCCGRRVVVGGAGQPGYGPRTNQTKRVECDRVWVRATRIRRRRGPRRLSGVGACGGGGSCWFTLALLTGGVYGWWRPTEAWPVALSAVFTPILTLERADERGDIPERVGNRMMAWATGYGVACGVAVAVGAWLAR
jgi:hypothetical protein